MAATQTNGTTTFTPRERISFDANVPVEVTVQSGGTEQLGRDGSVEYRYMLAGHKIMWVPQQAHDAITGSGAQWPATYEICKTKRGNKITWTVIQIEDEPDNQQAPTHSNQPLPQPARTATPASQPAPRPAASEPPASETPASEYGSMAYYTALCAAIRCAAAAERFATSIGRPIAFDTSDIRAMAATLYIQNQGGK